MTIANGVNITKEYALLAASELRYDPRVQRDAKPVKIETFSKKFDPMKLGTIIVAQRSEGGHWVIDGQHRSMAAQRAGYDGKIPAIVYSGLSLADEAEMFLAHNADSTNVNAVDNFKAAVTAGRPAEKECSEILSARGWRVRSGGMTGCLSAIQSVLKVHNEGGAAVIGRTIDAITNAWGHQVAGVNSSVVGGMGLVFAERGDDIEDKSLSAALEKVTPEMLLAQGRARKDALGGGVRTHVADAILTHYNKGRRSTKIKLVSK